ncbi:unnamed protein product [Rhizophagus irregularis]|nr:unnamed protein product [Rhizophagus irregularis]
MHFLNDRSSAFGWASEVQKLQRFVRPFGFSRSGGLPKYRNSKDSFGRSGGLPKYGKTKFRSAVRVGFRSIENPKDSFGLSGSAVRVGFRSIENPKDSFGRSGGLLKYGKTKFRSDVPKNWKIPRFDLVGFRRTEKGEPLRFVRVDFCLSKERKKLKIRFGGFPKNQDS